MTVFFILLAQSASAQFYTGPIAESMGGAGRAGSSPSESAFLNPATLAEIKSYYGAMSAGWGDHPLDGGLSQFSALLADGTPDKAFPGQFSYAQKRIALPSGLTTSQQDFQLGLAYAPLETLAFGLSIHRLTYTDNQNRSNAQNNLTFGSLFSPAKSRRESACARRIIPNMGPGSGLCRKRRTGGRSSLIRASRRRSKPKSADPMAPRARQP